MRMDASITTPKIAATKKIASFILNELKEINNLYATTRSKDMRGYR